MFDISAVGSRATIKFAGDSSPITINEWSDEGTPFDCPDVDLSDNQKNLNGQMISSRKPSVYTVAITVIPNSIAYIRLMKKAQEAAIMPGSVTDISKLKVESIILSVPKINQSSEDGNNGIYDFKWTNGRMKNAPTGPSTSTEGRLSAKTFSFEMEKFIPPESADSIDAVAEGRE